MSRFVLASVLCSLVACKSSDKDATPPGAPSSAPSAPTSGGPTVPGATPPMPVADDAACKAVPKDDAATMLGHPVGDGAAKASKAGAACAYKATDDSHAALSVLLDTNGDVMLPKNLRLMASPVEIPGVGTKAYRSPDGSQLGVLANGKLVWVLAVISGTPGPTVAHTEQIAKAVAGRL